MSDEVIQNLKDNAKKIESDAYEMAHTQYEYYDLLAKKSYAAKKEFGKLLDVKKKKYFFFIVFITI